MRLAASVAWREIRLVIFARLSIYFYIYVSCNKSVFVWLVLRYLIVCYNPRYTAAACARDLLIDRRSSTHPIYTCRNLYMFSLMDFFGGPVTSRSGYSDLLHHAFRLVFFILDTCFGFTYAYLMPVTLIYTDARTSVD